MLRFIITIGSSHPSGIAYLDDAKAQIATSNCVIMVGQSRVYKNTSVFTIYNHLFYNCAVAIKTNMEAHALYRELQAIEHQLGRIRSYKNAPRTIDIDVLMSLDLVYISSHFFVPHQQAWKRNFFVIPAIEALRSAGWPLPLHLFKSGLTFGTGYLQPVTSI